MSNDEEKNNKGGSGDDDDEHEHDMVMPGFRFHPTEEELVEFYLRRKVEGKRFNVELITFLDLYRYDPWELPALATIGEKEWYFYVPRDRKYRNGDRPNRVTTSGYWKATGADRMIRGENSRSIGLKKTLVFYSGKAPKGTRTSWIMNEYRLPHHETERYQKAEISLCRVYKRPGVEDYSNSSSHHLPRSLPTTRAPSSSRDRESNDNRRHKQPAVEHHCTIISNSDAVQGFQPLLPPPHHHHAIDQINTTVETDHLHHHGGSSGPSVAFNNYDHHTTVMTPAGVPLPVEAREHQALPTAALTYQQLVPASAATVAFGTFSSSGAVTMAAASSSAVLQDDLHRLVNYHNQFSYATHQHHHPSSSHQLSALLMPPQQQPQQLGVSSSTTQQLSVATAAATLTDRVVWDWSPIVPNPDYNPDNPNSNPFK
ncbi:hypothetical protein CRG98_029335 [Punica granatum]|uniref:NAC domain-containing protein n=1 Tax=Punica granatum TaxID=22663 RepID=A0A2I0J1Z1_PUNGR|nr:hypothetical protein CRG98_029335 [Punica granatum]